MTTPTPDEPQLPEEQQASVEHDIMLPAEVADYFRLGKFTMTLWLADPNKTAFPNSYKIGGNWRIPRSDVIALAKRFQEGFEMPDLKPGRGRK